MNRWFSKTVFPIITVLHISPTTGILLPVTPCPDREGSSIIRTSSAVNCSSAIRDHCAPVSNNAFCRFPLSHSISTYGVALIPLSATSFIMVNFFLLYFVCFSGGITLNCALAHDHGRTWSLLAPSPLSSNWGGVPSKNPSSLQWTISLTVTGFLGFFGPVSSWDFLSSSSYNKTILLCVASCSTNMI